MTIFMLSHDILILYATKSSLDLAFPWSTDEHINWKNSLNVISVSFSILKFRSFMIQSDPRNFLLNQTHWYCFMFKMLFYQFKNEK